MQPGYDQYERAMYAALCGHLKPLLPACSSWYDHLWAHLTVLLDVKREQVRGVVGAWEDLGGGACAGYSLGNGWSYSTDRHITLSSLPSPPLTSHPTHPSLRSCGVLCTEAGRCCVRCQLNTGTSSEWKRPNRHVLPRRCLLLSPTCSLPLQSFICWFVCIV